MGKTKRSVRGALLKGVLEHIPHQAFDLLKESIEETMKGKSGIYALYKKDKLVYVGMARSVRGRVKTHTRDKHTNNWDNFSIYLVEDVEILYDIETIISRIADPPENAVRGKIPRMGDFKKILQKEARRQERSTSWITKALKKKTNRRKTKKRTARRKTKRKTKRKTRRKTTRKK